MTEVMKTTGRIDLDKVVLPDVSFVVLTSDAHCFLKRSYGIREGTGLIFKFTKINDPRFSSVPGIGDRFVAHDDGPGDAGDRKLQCIFECISNPDLYCIYHACSDSVNWKNCFHNQHKQYLTGSWDDVKKLVIDLGY